MSVIEQLDQWILNRIDRFVAWNRDRGRADQWAIAEACLDMGFAMFVASFILTMFSDQPLSLLTSVFYVGLFFMLGFMRSHERRLIRRLSAAEKGSQQVRVGEASLRQTNLVILAIMMLLWLPNADAGDVMFIVSVTVFDLTHYFKAADPPPPARRSEADIAIRTS